MIGGRRECYGLIHSWFSTLGRNDPDMGSCVTALPGMILKGPGKGKPARCTESQALHIDIHVAWQEEKMARCTVTYLFMAEHGYEISEKGVRGRSTWTAFPKRA